jgi:hypothetical protein
VLWFVKDLDDHNQSYSFHKVSHLNNTGDAQGVAALYLAAWNNQVQPLGVLVAAKAHVDAQTSRRVLFSIVSFHL